MSNVIKIYEENEAFFAKIKNLKGNTLQKILEREEMKDKSLLSQRIANYVTNHTIKDKMDIFLFCRFIEEDREKTKVLVNYMQKACYERDYENIQKIMAELLNPSALNLIHRDNLLNYFLANRKLNSILKDDFLYNLIINSYKCEYKKDFEEYFVRLLCQNYSNNVYVFNELFLELLHKENLMNEKLLNIVFEIPFTTDSETTIFSFEQMLEVLALKYKEHQHNMENIQALINWKDKQKLMLSVDDFKKVKVNRL